ncbi:MAG: flagellar hook-associated protein FlgK [Betaproteobacteria bacterium]|nr:flagellar hook-associated protein FlgK [Betaproteobacteria bacterium]
MASLLSLGTSALNAANVGLRTTGHNIANVNTPGYSRQVAVATTPTPQFSGSGFFGRGVEISTVRRVYDGFLTAQAHTATARAGEAQSRAGQLDLVNSILGTTDGGIGAAMNDFQGALGAAANYPGDLASRQSALSSIQALATQFNDAAARLSDQRRGVESQLRDLVGNVNRQLQDVAALNGQIQLAQGNGQPPNDLLDRRDTLVRNLSETLGVTAVAQDDGTMSLFVGNGQSVVLGGNASTLTLQPDAFDPRHPVLGVTKGSTFSAIDTRELSGGALGGLLKFADQDLAQVEDEIGRLALATASAYNARHRLGLDAEGRPGADLFRIAAPVTASSRTNTGTGAITASVADASALAASGYRVDFDGTNFAVTRLSDQVTRSYASLPQTVDGIAFGMGGAPAAGDSFTVNAVREVAASISAAISRPQSLALALPVTPTAAAANGGTLKVTGFAVPGPAADPNLTQGVSIRFTSATTFDVTGTGTGNPTGLAYTPGQPVSFNGWTLTMEGTPVAGDTMNVGASTAWNGDNRNGLALGGIAGSNLVDGLSLTESLAGLFGKVGTLASSLAATAEAQEAVRADAIGAETSLSGVNLDEEAARLMQYQQAYQAAAKVIASAQTIFDTLLDLGR